MPDAFTLTIIFILLAALLAAFLRRISTDKCLKDFRNFPVKVELIDKQKAWGNFNLKNTGFELIFSEKHSGSSGLIKSSFIIYKAEYPQIHALIRYHDTLTEDQKKMREKQLRKTYHPRMLRKMRRKFVNFFKTIRDSVAEVLNIFLAHVKKTTPAGNILTSQDKYINQMKSELIGSVGTSYEPILERHIGHYVILELLTEGQVIEHRGVLKDYSSEFIELMDIDYPADESRTQKADLIVPRKFGIIRHLSE